MPRISSKPVAWFWSLFGGPIARRRAWGALQIGAIHRRAVAHHQATDAALRDRFDELRYRALCGESLKSLVPETFGLVTEAARRHVGLTPYDVQLVAGSVLADRCVAEMDTGEGKTLTASLPLCLWALHGRGAWLVTANDYLARRDADLLCPVYECLGLSVGTLQADSRELDRREAYACDITYGTVREFGFDLLRDRLAIRRFGRRRTDLADVDAQRAPAGLRERLVQRRPLYVLVDEADSVLIDEARTPLVLSNPPAPPPPEIEASFRWSADLAEQMHENTHFVYDAHWHDALLTDAGRELVREAARDRAMSPLRQPELYKAVERAVRVRRNLRRDRDYIVRKSEVVVIDENTGRPGEGRQWQDGIHQAIEAREGLPLTSETDASAQITVQELFARFENLAGMTGTASTSAGEFRRTYQLAVVPIPTHRPSRRVYLPAEVVGTKAEKWTRVADSVRACAAKGRPVLVGTRSIADSLALSAHLKEADITHEILNANELEREAAIVATAGRRGSVVVATNMAGRGTDIRLEQGVETLGGLHVIATELHDSRRVDRQLAGRCGRQGDPGSVQAIYSIEDEVLTTAWGHEPAARIRARLAASSPAAILRALKHAQRVVEHKQATDRVKLVKSLESRRRAQRELGQDPYLDALE